MAVGNGRIMRGTLRVFIIFVTSCALCQTTDVFDGAVQFSCGTVQGTPLDQSPGVWAFRGLRYAAPPTGDLRWKPPQSATCNPDTKIVAHHNGQVCTQKNPILGFYAVANPGTSIRMLGGLLLGVAFSIGLCYYMYFLSTCKFWKKIRVQILGPHFSGGSEKLLGEGEKSTSRFELVIHCFMLLGALKCIVLGAWLLNFSFNRREYLGRVLGGEDCLFMNIYSHEDALTTPGVSLPVMFFIHGGDLTTGSGTDSGPGAFYGGSWALAATSRAVAVQFNYRLSALGFLYLEDEHGNSVLGDSANLGLLDQLAALRWVRDNIAHFGGDPGRVTIYGQSSGGTSVAALLASPLAHGLFHRAFTMSGSPRIDATPAQAALSWRKYFLPAFPACIGHWQGDNLRRCLHELSAEALVDYMPVQFSDPDWQNALPVSKDVLPAIDMVIGDGRIVLGNVSEVISRRDARLPNVPTIFGNVREDCDLDLKQVSTASRFDNAAWPFTEQQAMQWGVALTGDMAFGEKVWRLYKPTSDTQAFLSNPDAASSPIRQKWSQLTSDMRTICGNIHNAKQMAKGQDAPVYSYLFTHRPQAPVVSHIQGWPTWIAKDSSQYAFHMWDVILLFNRTAGYTNREKGLSYEFTPLDFAVADRFRAAVLEFAETGKIASWTAMEPDRHAVCKLDSETTCDKHLKKDECALFVAYDVAYSNWIIN